MGTTQFKIAFLFMLIGVINVSCNKDKAPIPNSSTILNCDTILPTFANDIQPLFLTHCATINCHSSSTNASGYTTESYSQIKADINFFLSTMKQESGVVAMPFYAPKLPDSTLQKVECWIADGSPNN